MITFAHLKNFEVYIDQKFEFSPRTNIFVGTTDAGKSAVIRAIIWVFYNLPRGDKSRRHGAKSYSVAIGLDSGFIVTRAKGGKGGNRYILKHPNGKEDIFKAFGSEVPKEIKSLLNVRDYTVQKQLDLPFLLTTTSAEVARVLNRVAKLDDIDATLANLNGELSKARTEIKRSKDDIEQLTAKYNQYDGLATTERLLDSTKALQRRFYSIRQQRQSLRPLIISLEDNQVKAARLKKVKRLSEELIALKGEYAKEQTVRKYMEGLDSLISSIQKSKRKVRDMRTRISNLETVRKRLIPKICPTCKQPWPKEDNDGKIKGQDF